LCAKEVPVETARSWLEDNPDVRESVMAGFESDPRLQADALPDAILVDPKLLVDIAKEFVGEAVRRDAPEGVAEELLVAVRRMTAGERAMSPYMRAALQDLRGLRDASEIETALHRALDDATDDDRGKLENFIALVKNPKAVAEMDAKVLPPDTGFSPVDCVACCALACVICTEVCPVCCGIGCIWCG
jgi:hypothetical protein